MAAADAGDRVAEGVAAWQTLRAPMFMRVTGVLLAVLVAAAVLVWVVPGTLDWSRYRGTIAGFASRELGRPVRIDGPIAVTLLPAPLVTAGDVRLVDPGDGIALTAPVLRLRLAFAPLLLGRVVPRALVLSGAAIALPWPLPPSAMATSRQGWLAGSSARIEHGSVTIGALKLTDLDADLAAGPEPGALGIDGTARGFGQYWRLAARFGAADSLGDAPLEASAEAERRGAEGRGSLPPPDAYLRLVGTLAHDGALAGRMSARAADLSLLLPAPPVAGSAEGTIGLGGQGPARADLNVAIGNVAIAARLRPAVGGTRQVLSLTAGRLDLDAWDVALARLRAGQNAGGMITLPWPVSLDMTADAVSLRGGLIRAVHAVLDVDGHRGVLHQATALLPGEASLAVAGTLVEDVFGLTLNGRATLDAPQFRATLGWLRQCGLRLGSFLPPDVLRTARLAGSVTARRDGVQVSGLTGSIDGGKVTGRIAVETASGAIDADLALDTLAADDWIAADFAPRWTAFAPGLAGADVALKLHARTTRWRGRSIQDLALDAASSAGGVMINRLEATLDGLHGRLSGTIGADGGVTDGQFDLTAAHATALGALLPPGLHTADYLWAGPVRVHAEANGRQDALITSVSLDLDDARLEAHPTIDLDTGAWTTRLTLRHPGAPRLLDALGLPRAGDWVGEGSLSLLAQATGGAGTLRLDSFDLTAGTLHASGDLQWAAAGGTPTLTGHVAADTLPLPPFSPHATAPVPLGWLGGWAARVGLSAGEVSVGDATLLRNAAARLTLNTGILSLDGLQATLAGGAMTASARLDSTAVPPRIDARAAVAGAAIGAGLFAATLDIGSGTADAQLTLSAGGYSPAALVASLAGAASLTARAGTLDGIDLAAARAAADQGALNAALNAGTTRYDRLAGAATIANGTATLTRVDLAGPDGTLAADGTVDLAADTLNVRLQLPGQAGIRLSGKPAAPHRTIEAALLAGTR